MNIFKRDLWHANIGDAIVFNGKPGFLTNVISLNRRQKMITMRFGKEKETAIINRKNEVISTIEKRKVGSGV